jgi:hypothetical protein
LYHVLARTVRLGILGITSRHLSVEERIENDLRFKSASSQEIREGLGIDSDKIRGPRVDIKRCGVSRVEPIGLPGLRVLTQIGVYRSIQLQELTVTYRPFHLSSSGSGVREQRAHFAAVRTFREFCGQV